MYVFVGWCAECTVHGCLCCGLMLVVLRRILVMLWLCVLFVCVFRLGCDLWGMFLGIVWVWRRCLLCVGYLLCFIRELESDLCG